MPGSAGRPSSRSWLGGVVFWIFIAGVAVLAMAEWAGLARAVGVRAGLGVLALAAAMLFAAPMLWGTDRSTVALVVSLGIVVAAIVGNTRLGVGVGYVGTAAIGILFLRGLPGGLALALWTLLVVIATDTGAYFAGRAIGGPLLAPRLSPKKTWAGLGGGMLAAAIVGGWRKPPRPPARGDALARPTTGGAGAGGRPLRELAEAAGGRQGFRAAAAWPWRLPRSGGWGDPRRDPGCGFGCGRSLVVRSVTILGATGSIGTSTLDLIEREPERFRVDTLTAGRDVAKLAEIAQRTGARRAVIGEEAGYGALKEALAGTGTEAAAGSDAIAEAGASGADWTMAAIVGTAGLRPVMAALAQGGTVALANKEALVSAGALMTRAAGEAGATLLPVDSEHNAVFQCFPHGSAERVRRIVLTASGGPFRTTPRAELEKVTPEQAVRHPNWSMGAKISVDSATLMNKGLELIEAFHLFPVGAERLDILVHPQSVVHSMVDYVDGSTLAQLGTPDMRTPIAHTLAWPDRMETPCTPLDLAKVGRLDFEAPDYERFPALGLALGAMRAGGAAPAVLNAANEIAVAAFLDRRIGFLQIPFIVEQVLASYTPPPPASIDEVLAVDSEARTRAQRLVEA